MASFQPIVLENLDLTAVIDYVLGDQQAGSTLIVCSSKEDFVRCLRNPTPEPPRTDDVPPEDDPDGEFQGVNEQNASPPPRNVSSKWSTPTLRLLASSRNIAVAFCPDLAHLRAYLAAYATRLNVPQVTGAVSSSTDDTARRLVVLNAIALHRHTPAFSAQGFSRTFANAVEAAHCNHSQLVLIECAAPVTTDPTDEFLLDNPTALGQEEAPANPWDEEISLLNITTKSFGVGDRGWVGRTVSIRQVAARWCSFETLAPRR